MPLRRFRYYDPVTGSFTQQDPIGLAGGLNLYGFAEGDPVNFSDPFGLKVFPIGKAARAAVNSLLEGSPTFSRLYKALENASVDRVSLSIHEARAPNEFETLAINARASGMNSSYMGRTPHSPDGRIVYNPTGSMSNLETWLGHEIVHAAGQYADVVQDQTGVAGGCGQHTPFRPANCQGIEDTIRQEMEDWRARQSANSKPPVKQ